ncbi:MAG: NAD(P)/FAD-dependent oxidoreductase [Verrucomicrobiota bacterium JB022]|nr:NAD(P)/FAD-dependent oxidoreductase [Verrucomicrobiota bacterium JB022]
MNFDVIIIGGSFAGLSTALYLARSRRRVLVIDAGEPRNRFAAASHSFLGQDGVPPGQILSTAREQLRAYPEVTFWVDLATRARHEADGFIVETWGGQRATGKFLVLTTGVRDELPDIPGLAERWGKSVAHCPFCHGYEFGGAPLGVLATGSNSIHQAHIIPQWGPTTFFTNGAITLSDEERASLESRSVVIETEAVAALEGAGEALEHVRLTSGRVVPVRALFLAPKLQMTSPLPEQLGCELTDTMVGRLLSVGPDQQTTVPGVYAAGDVAAPTHNVAFAVADGAKVAGAINFKLFAIPEFKRPA